MLAVALMFLLAAAPGCSHPCGYAEVRVTAHPIAGAKSRVRERGWVLMVSQHPTAQDPTVRVRLSQKVIVEERVIREFSGRQVRTPYHWITPVVKPILPVTMALGIVMPFRHPHDHAADLWGLGDYARDFWAWVNPLEAFPLGRRRIYADRAVFRRERAWAASRRMLAPVPNARVRVALAGTILAVAKTGERGECAIDLGRLGHRIPRTGPVVLTLHSRGAHRRVVLDAGMIATLQR